MNGNTIIANNIPRWRRKSPSVWDRPFLIGRYNYLILLFLFYRPIMKGLFQIDVISLSPIHIFFLLRKNTSPEDQDEREMNW